MKAEFKNTKKLKIMNNDLASHLYFTMDLARYFFRYNRLGYKQIIAIIAIKRKIGNRLRVVDDLVFPY